ncbi:hypothetical protein SDC9_69517 [bioreactor metagenome]|uniref:Uncharacterized protein n=1 Tax=bioreactor metagenome TaxID=1076179 RepID=A0A644YAB0_9ZZZZ
MVVFHGKLNKNRGTFIFGIFDLGLCQGSLVLRAPVDGLQPFIDIALFRHNAKNADLFGFKIGTERQIRMEPVAHAPKAHEFLPLFVHEGERVFLALLPELGGGKLFPLHLFILENGAFNGKTVSVPAGHIRSAPTGHVLIPHNDILQNFVECGTNMDVAVGIGRAVMKNEFRLSLIFFHEVSVNVGRLEGSEHFRLPAGQSRAHGKIGLGQIDGLIVVLRHGVVLLYF